MSEQVYVVTLYKYEDLEDFYTEMESNGFRIHLKRPISRNTHYWMTDEQAVELRQDPRVWDVQLTPEELGMTPEASAYYVNTEPYTINGQFWKNDTTAPTTIDPTDYQWGHIHVAGTTAQRRKGTFGTGNVEKVTDTIEIFNSGRHVDVVICDDPVSYDCGEWESPSNPGTSRFVQYDWFNELNQYVSSIDDDNQTLPTGAVTYRDNATNPTYHGTHVAGTVAGQHYGWAREANIYGLQVLGTMPSGQSLPAMLIFDYLRAFHRYKPINPTTGKRNPTVCNHSWGYGYNGWGSVPIAEINNIYDSATGNNYNAGNPNPSGWTQDGINKDFGVGPRPNSRLNAIYTALEADATDAMEDGVIQVGAANNNNQLQVHQSDPRYDSIVTRNESNYPLYKGSAPTNAPGFICVGAIENRDDFRRATYTNYGPRVDIFAPGSNIVSSFGSTGIADSKYGGSNYYYPIGGTSMASPQVCGVLACVASGKDRFTNDDAIQYLRRTGLPGDMTFDIGGTASATFAFDVPSATFSDYSLTGTDRLNTWTNQADPNLVIYEGDTITFNINNLGSHPFEIRSALGGPAVPGVVNNGATNGLIEWDTTGVTPGVYYYQCIVHSNMNGQIEVQQSDQGSQADNTCQQGSPNLELRAVNERQDIIDTGGFVDHLNFTRRFEKSNQLYPRRKSIFIANAFAPTTYTLSINNSGSSLYQASGDDANGTKTGGTLTHISCDVGDTLVLNVNAASHPFWIKTTRTTGTANAVTTGITNNGTDSGTITWDTTNVTPGVYYFNCETHSSMSGAIFIQGNSDLSSQTFIQSISTWLTSGFISSLGKDRDGYYQNTISKGFNLNVGDTFMVLLRDGYPTDAPLWIKTADTAGSADAITGGVTNNGSSIARTLITWDTTGYSPGTYYYVDGNNSSRTETITLS